jgi:hypothetical protein
VKKRKESINEGQTGYVITKKRQRRRKRGKTKREKPLYYFSTPISPILTTI